MTDTQYEALISLLLSRYWEQQMKMTLRQCQAVLRAVSNPLFSLDGERATTTLKEDMMRFELRQER